MEVFAFQVLIVQFGENAGHSGVTKCRKREIFRSAFVSDVKSIALLT